MLKGKYVVGYRDGNVMAIIFPEHAVHLDMAIRVFGSSRNVLGAGFCSIDPHAGEPVTVSGHSVTLGVASRPQDVEYVAEAIGISFDTESAQTYHAASLAANRRIDLNAAQERGMVRLAETT